MKILVVIYSLSAGGAERVTANLANYWADKGWEITVVSITGKERDFYELHPDIHRIALQLDADSTSVVEAIRHNVHRVLNLRAVLKRERPDVALGMMTTANCLLSMAATGTGIPAIGSERIHPPKLPIGRVWSWMRRRTYPNLSAVTALTKKSAQWLRMQTRVNRVLVIPNPVTYPMACQEPRLQPAQVMGAAYDEHILLAVGRLVQQKGFDRLLDAFAELAPRFPEWYLVILGEGEERNKLARMIGDLNLESQVFLPGAVGNVREWYEAADLYVMTSRFEGFPNTLIEALAHGLPAVSVDCDTGPRDILRHEVDGLLVPQNDHIALVEALAKIMSDENLRACCASRAVEVRERFSLERIAAMWEALFVEVMNES